MYAEGGKSEKFVSKHASFQQNLIIVMHYPSQAKLFINKTSNLVFFYESTAQLDFLNACNFKFALRCAAQTGTYQFSAEADRYKMMLLIVTRLPGTLRCQLEQSSPVDQPNVVAIHPSEFELRAGEVWDDSMI